MAQTANLPAWLRPDPSARVRLFCFPYAGGSAAWFRSWRDELRPAIDLCPVQIPGRGNRFAEPPLRRCPALCEMLAAELRPWLDVPFAFFGHSMGALVAFELARHLRRHARVGPMHLFLSGAPGPRRPLPSRLHCLPEPALIAELSRLNGTPPEILAQRQFMSIVIPFIRADLELYETHVYSSEDLLDCPISAFAGVDDALARREDVAAWRHETRGAFTLRMFEGDHFFLHRARAPLLRAISEDLSQATLAAVEDGAA
jgi:medium-chain acyl-[acyl-carrier-protein] hydrolase